MDFELLTGTLSSPAGLRSQERSAFSAGAETPSLGWIEQDDPSFISKTQLRDPWILLEPIVIRLSGLPR